MALQRSRDTLGHGGFDGRYRIGIRRVGVFLHDDLPSEAVPDLTNRTGFSANIRAIRFTAALLLTKSV
jgi:hypothetical protein